MKNSELTPNILEDFSNVKTSSGKIFIHNDVIAYMNAERMQAALGDTAASLASRANPTHNGLDMSDDDIFDTIKPRSVQGMQAMAEYAEDKLSKLQSDNDTGKE